MFSSVSSVTHKITGGIDQRDCFLKQLCLSGLEETTSGHHEEQDRDVQDNLVSAAERKKMNPQAWLVFSINDGSEGSTGYSCLRTIGHGFNFPRVPDSDNPRGDQGR